MREGKEGKGRRQNRRKIEKGRERGREREREREGGGEKIETQQLEKA